MTKTPDEIKKGLDCCWSHRAKDGSAHCYECPYLKNHDKYYQQCKERMMVDVIAYIHQLEDRNNALYHTILGVMHFVDKWLNDKGYDPESDQNGSIAIDRAARAREIALRAIEEAEKRQPF